MKAVAHIWYQNLHHCKTVHH